MVDAAAELTAVRYGAELRPASSDFRRPSHGEGVRHTVRTTFARACSSSTYQIASAVSGCRPRTRAAVALADEAGIEALSMRRLAQALGVVPMALYKHVANKDELLDGVIDVVVGEIDPPGARSGRAGSPWT